MQKLWQPHSWQEKSCAQAIVYPDLSKASAIVEKLGQLPPLVTPLEIQALTRQLAKAARGEAFILQGGDCAELFSQCRADIITNKLKILLQMSLVLIHGLRKPVVRIGRIAGQYAKPRSCEYETRDGISLPSYRGDIINQQEFTQAARIPNPAFMLQGYQYAALTLNYIRALVDGGFADLQHPEYWHLDFVQHSPLAEEYQNLVKTIIDALGFMNSIASVHPETLHRIDFYTSHEALNLYYEQALTRQQPNGHWYNLSTHFPWIGMRTAQLDGAHVAFFRGIRNPIGVKIGPKTSPEFLAELIHILNPDNEPGRLTLIVRIGAKQISDLLPPLIEQVKRTNKTVLWFCDPMHGNTDVTTQGIKTRRFDDILVELQQSFRIHQEYKTILGGVHFELTGENVTECIGGARGISETDLHRAYESVVDPRLNYEQALEMALLIARDYATR